MSKFDIKDKIDRALYDSYNFASDLLFLFNLQAKKILKENLVYKDKHKGERCFILGTGPSLNFLSDHQVEALNREIIFGANSLYKAEVVSTVVPKYYALLDNLYWGQWSHTFSEVMERYQTTPPIFITDLRAIDLAQQANPLGRHIYVHSKKYPVRKMSEKLDTNIYGAMNVISYSILAAIYMGFKEVYLLGCDYNAFCTAGKGHAYNDESEVKQSNYNLAFYLKFYWITTEFHYLIAKLAREKGVIVANLTPGSLLDAYDRRPINDLLG